MKYLIALILIVAGLKASCQKDSTIRQDSAKCYIQYFVEVKPGIVLTRHSPCVAIYDVHADSTQVIKKILINGQEFDTRKRYILFRQDQVVK
jgi:hypothetical protein